MIEAPKRRRGRPPKNAPTAPTLPPDPARPAVEEMGQDGRQGVRTGAGKARGRIEAASK